MKTFFKKLWSILSLLFLFHNEEAIDENLIDLSGQGRNKEGK